MCAGGLWWEYMMKDKNKTEKIKHQGQIRIHGGQRHTKSRILKHLQKMKDTLPAEWQ
jgi:hypothetical protein